ncbi:GDYXXLXY domain-containing protein [Methylibium sp.]|uniref:GDYXXLXY domain-containing protein n=1 Tax=Methylibium sp. TaxID=2067992 RepID=UPI003D09653D
MSGARADGLLRAAVAEGLLPPAATLPAQDSRPWPVVLLTALGAWLATIPLLGVVGLLLGDLISRSAGPYFVGVLLLAAAIVVLRSRDLPLFWEQLAVPALLVGGGALGFGLFRDLPVPAGAAVLALAAVGVALAVSGPWLRVLLGAAAALLLVTACASGRWQASQPSLLTRFWCAWHLSLAVWLVAGWVQRTALHDGARTRRAAALESLSAGWLLASLGGLAWWSGMSFLVGGSLGGGFAGEVARELSARSSAGWAMPLQQAASLALAAAAALWAARRWPTLRTPWHAGVALVPLALAWFMPALGAVLLALALCVTTARWRLATTAAVAAAWIVGAFYYRLDWPLATKSVLLMAAGAVLAALAWRALRAAAPADGPPRAAAPDPRAPGARWGIALSALAVLAVANFGIGQKEDLIVHGQPVYVELAPVDPRSLMQGDFMRLNFRVPDEVQAKADRVLSASRPRVVARRDARGVATLLHLDEGAALAADELRFELTPRNGRWTLVSDAWFFKEGEAARWTTAKYGEFRVDPSGRALLVGLRGGNLESL